MEPNDAELAKQLGTAADGVEATSDLDAVLLRAGPHRRRQRTLSIGAAAAVVALGVGGVVLVANRDTDELPAAQPDPIVVPLTTLPPSDDVQPASTVLLNDEEASAEVDQYPGGDPYQCDPNAPDPAEPYLEQTAEIYQRETPSGNDIQIRRSDVPYGELFGIEWDLPTGTWDECLGGDAVFIGSPDGPVQWLSTWTVQQWLPVDPAQEITIEEYSTESGPSLIVRSALEAQQVAVVQGGEIGDRADFVNGVAVVEMLPYSSGLYQNDDGGNPQLSVTVASDTGEAALRTFPVYGDYSYREAPGQCLPHPFPGQELPEPGAEQPGDVVAAEGAVRERHAILVDWSDAEKPEDILVDDTGVAEARAQMEAGGFADSAAEATYVIDGVVFTDAGTAWFEYAIVAPTGTFGQRFGQALYNGEVWQITRDTICQDLALASGYCDPDGPTQNVQPPLSDGVDFDQAVAEWEVAQRAYGERRFCNPLNPCGDFDLAGQLPDAYGFDRRVGEAVRIDGVWKITRATVCRDFSLGGVSCDLPD